MTAICTIHFQVRLAFKNCTRICEVNRNPRRCLHVPPPSRDPTLNSKAARKSPQSRSKSLEHGGYPEAKRRRKNSLVPSISKPGALERPKKPSLPVRVFPKAQATPNLVLSPEERLQVESMTRRPPKSTEKPVYRERMLIYHGGLRYTNYISFVRVTTIFAASFGLIIMAPAYYSYDGAPWWTVPLIILATTGPFFLVHSLARPFVCWIHLLLPLHARKSASAAMEYSKNLPRDALFQISFMRATALVGKVEARMSELIPRRRNWPPTSFEWVGSGVDRGTWFRRNTTRFFVNKRSGTGRAARDTVPGIWKSVYPIITGVERPPLK